jgi:hypothetical protein
MAIPVDLLVTGIFGYGLYELWVIPLLVMDYELWIMSFY